MKRNLLVIVDKRLDMPLDPMFGEIDASIDMLKLCYKNRSELYGSTVPVYFSDPDYYELYDCGSYDDVHGFRVTSPFVLHATPKFIGVLSDILEVK